MYIDKEAIRQAAQDTAIAHYARGLHIRETEENLQFLADSRARMEELKSQLGPGRYDQMKASLDNAQAELEALLKDLKSQ